MFLWKWSSFSSFLYFNKFIFIVYDKIYVNCSFRVFFKVKVKYFNIVVNFYRYSCNKVCYRKVFNYFFIVKFFVCIKYGNKFVSDGSCVCFIVCLNYIVVYDYYFFFKCFKVYISFECFIDKFLNFVIFFIEF